MSSSNLQTRFLNQSLWLLGVIWLYVAWRLWPSLPCGGTARVAILLALLAVAQYQQVTARFFGDLASAELPRPILIVLGWAYGSFLLVALLLLLRDVAGLVLVLPAPAIAQDTLGSTRLTLMLSGLAALLGAIGTWLGVRVPKVKTVHVSIAGLPAAFDGYRIVQLSDLHASRLLPASWIIAVVERSNALTPDLIVITGDLQDGTPQARALDVAPLAKLHADDGVLAIAGNHEYYEDYHGWIDALSRLGLHVLVNQHVHLHRAGQTIAVAGVTDRAARLFDLPLPDLAAATRGIAAATPVILLEHQPHHARTNAAEGIALQLSGHTHGGQILGPSWLAMRANAGFVSGLYRVGSMQLYVSNGTGLWHGLVLRLGVPSEITQLVLHATT